MLSLALEDLDFGFLKVLRMLRVLRPLRLIARNEGLKISLDALISSMPSILNILFITFFFFVIFGTMAMNFFKGQFYYCESTYADELPGYSEYNLIDKWDCINLGGMYVSRLSNFDTVPLAMATLFPVS